jgi:mRNA-degrading endonuclease RelE of RelBE toxin-antitoxin system
MLWTFSVALFDMGLRFFENESMARKQPFALSYDAATEAQLRAIPKKYHAEIRKSVEEQLLYQPETETRNRKPLRQPAPFEATWELRCGHDNRFRVLYGIDHDRRAVQIQAIGMKKGNRLFVAGEEIKL